MPEDPRSPHRPLLLGAALVAVLLAGFAVRKIGLLHGKPDLIFHPDVSKQAAVAGSAAAGRLELRGRFRDKTQLTLYPYGAAVLVGRAHRLAATTTDASAGIAPSRWLWAFRLRYFSVTIFLAAVGVLLLVRGSRAGPLATLLTGLLLVLEPLNVQHGHYGMNDVPMVSLLLLAWLSAGSMERERSTAPVGSLLTGVLLGMAFGIKYQAALGGVFLVAGWAGVWRRKGLRGLLFSVGAGMAGGGAGVALTVPLLLEDPAYFLVELPQFLAWQSNILGQQMSLVERTVRNARTMGELLGSSFRWVLFAGAAATLLRCGIRGERPKARQRLSALLFCALLGATLVVGRDFVRSNDVLPLLAFATVICGDGLAASVAGARWRRLFFAGATLAVVVFSTISLRDSLALGRTDTRVLARDWSREHLPPGTVVVRERYTLPVARTDVLEYAVRDFANPEARALLDAGTPDHIILSSLAHDRFSDAGSPYFDEPVARLYGGLGERWEQIAVFSDRRLIFAHPEVRVLRRIQPAAMAHTP